MKVYQIRGIKHDLRACQYTINYVSDVAYNDMETAVATLDEWYVKDSRNFHCVPCLKRGKLTSYSCASSDDVHFIYSIYELEVL